jgi:hypothetical protein
VNDTSHGLLGFLVTFDLPDLERLGKDWAVEHWPFLLVLAVYALGGWAFWRWRQRRRQQPKGRHRRLPTVGKSARTDWREPVVIGRGEDGLVTLDADEANTLIAGRPGSGKTSVARIVLAHYLLDPVASVYLLDGKGSRKDYGACRDLCARFVWGTDDTAIEDTLSMLWEVLDLVRARNAAFDGESEPVGVLVLLEEFQDVRASADKAVREDLDNVLGRIVRMGRAVGCHVLVSTQRPTTDDLPSGVRNLISQRLALMLRNGEDARIVLGSTPEIPLPTKRGEGLLCLATGTQAVRLSHLTDTAWAAVCGRASSLRHPPRSNDDVALDETAGQGRGAILADVVRNVERNVDREPVKMKCKHCSNRWTTTAESNARCPKCKVNHRIPVGARA